MGRARDLNPAPAGPLGGRWFKRQKTKNQVLSSPKGPEARQPTPPPPHLHPPHPPQRKTALLLPQRGRRSGPCWASTSCVRRRQGGWQAPESPRSPPGGLPRPRPGNGLGPERRCPAACARWREESRPKPVACQQPIQATEPPRDNSLGGRWPWAASWRGRDGGPARGRRRGAERSYRTRSAGYQ